MLQYIGSEGVNTSDSYRYKTKLTLYKCMAYREYIALCERVMYDRKCTISKLLLVILYVL